MQARLPVMRNLWLNYLKTLLILLVLSVALIFVAYHTITLANQVFGGQAPNWIRAVLVLVFIVIYVLLWNITAAKPYRELQEAKRRAKEAK